MFLDALEEKNHQSWMVAFYKASFAWHWKGQKGVPNLSLLNSNYDYELNFAILLA